jgi:hypothetical protein
MGVCGLQLSSLPPMFDDVPRSLVTWFELKTCVMCCPTCTLRHVGDYQRFSTRAEPVLSSHPANRDQTAQPTTIRGQRSDTSPGCIYRCEFILLWYLWYPPTRFSHGGLERRRTTCPILAGLSSFLSSRLESSVDAEGFQRIVLKPAIPRGAEVTDRFPSRVQHQAKRHHSHSQTERRSA